MTKTRQKQVRHLGRVRKEYVEHAEKETTRDWLVSIPREVMEDLPDNVRHVTSGRVEHLGSIIRRAGFADALKGDQGAWMRVYAGSALEWSSRLAESSRFVGPAESVAALTALAFGEVEMSFALVAELLRRGLPALEQYPTCSLAPLLWAKLEGGEKVLLGSWVTHEHLQGYARAFDALNHPDDLQQGLLDACDEHMRLMGMKQGAYLDFYADMFPVDIVALMRAFELLHGKRVALPDHPLMDTLIANIPSVAEQPELRSATDELYAGFVRGALKSGMFVTFPGARAGSERWPAPPEPWASLAEEVRSK